MGAGGAIGSWNWGIEAFRVPGAAPRVAQRNGALQTRDLSTFGTWYGPGCGAPLTRCTASGEGSSLRSHLRVTVIGWPPAPHDRTPHAALRHHQDPDPQRLG